MALVILLFGGLFGVLFGVASFVLGYSLISSVLVYGAAAHIISMFLLWRYEKSDLPDARQRLTEREVRADLQALREAEERNLALATTDGSSLFRLLRMTAEEDRSRASARAARRAVF